MNQRTAWRVTDFDRTGEGEGVTDQLIGCGVFPGRVRLLFYFRPLSLPASFTLIRFVASERDVPSFT